MDELTRPDGERHFGGGVNSGIDPLHLAPGEVADALNIDFDRGSAAYSRGSFAMNNQRLRRCGVRTRGWDGRSLLSVGAGKGVPMRGYVFLPYDEESDIGGDLVENGTTPWAPGGDTNFYWASSRRGRSFDLQVTFRVPEDQRLFTDDLVSSNAVTPSAGDTIGTGEALLAHASIAQKGGDRTTPMSWSLGITYFGTKYAELTGADAAQRKTGYHLTFSWLDAPEWGAALPEHMQYRLDTSSNVVTDNAAETAGEGSYCSLAYRTIAFDRPLEPGREYTVSLQVQLDSDTPTWSGSAHTTDWSDDGFVKLHLIEGPYGALETYSFAAGGSPSGIDILHGQRSSNETLEYLCKYGVRYGGKDAVFLGLGQRQSPAHKGGSIPMGVTSAPVEQGGFRMVNYADRDHSDFGLGSQPLSVLCGTGNQVGFLATNMVVASSGDVAQGFSPLAVNASTSYWLGVQSARYTKWCLDGYLTAFLDDDTNDTGGANTGLRVQIETLAPSGSFLTVASTRGLDDAHNTVTCNCVIYPFRWHQIDLELSDFRIYSEPRDFTDPRTLESLRVGFDADDVLDPTRSTLLGCWPLDDGEGGAVRSAIGGPTGYLAPFTLAQDEEGARGTRRLFLSGEGEALTLDLARNPVAKRELERVLRATDGGFAIELSCVLPEQSNALAEAVTGGDEGAQAPVLASWEVEDPDASELATRPKALLRLTHRGLATGGSSRVGWRKPAGFTVEYQEGSDQEDEGVGLVGGQWDSTDFTWGNDAPWVGKRITMQFGVEPQGSGSFRVYLAVTPRERFVDSTAAQKGQEYAFFATATLSAKELVRSRIVIGGGWDTKARGRTLGYTDLNARMIVDEVRVFGAPAAGALPASSPGSPVTDGKIQLRRKLGRTDIYRTVGPNTRVASVLEGSPTVTQRPWQADSKDELDAAVGCFFGVYADDFLVLEDETIPQSTPEFYRVASVAATSLTLDTPYSGPSQTAAAAYICRLLGYASLDDDLGSDVLAVGGGDLFDAGVTLASAAVETGNLFANPVPVRESWQIRLFNPLGTSLARVAASWCMAPRRPWSNRGLGVHGVNDRLYALTRGMLYEADDRWRENGPYPDRRYALAFRGGELAADQRRPLANDWLETTVPAAAVPTPPASAVEKVISVVYTPAAVDADAALLWLGDKAADQTLAKSASGLAGAFDWCLAVEGGFPVLRVSSEQAGASGTPARGVYRAVGQRRLRAGRRTRITVRIPYTQTRTWFGEPRIYLDREEVAVELAGTGTGASTGDWLQLSGIEVAPTGEDSTFLVGCSMEPHADEEVFAPYQSGEPGPSERQATGIVGRTESAHGELSQILVWNASSAFDPTTWDPEATSTGLPSSGVASYFSLPLQEGVGHVVRSNDNGTARSIAIEALPGIPLLAGIGARDQLYSTTVHQGRLFAANGGRVVVADEGEGRFAGVPTPRTKPSFELERVPLWVPNQDADASTATDNAVASAENGPVVGAQPGSAAEINHYQTLGQSYMRQPYNPLLEWSSGRAWCVKGYVRLNETGGKIDLWTSRQGADSGRFIQCVDGKLRVGWFDSTLKEQVGWETSSPVFIPGYVHYVHIRKQWPQDDATDGNWQTQFPVVDASNWKDLIVVRRFAKVTAEDDPTDPASPYFFAKTDGSTFNCVSFTPDDGPAGTTATGMVTPGSGVTYSASSGTDTVTASTGVFHPDMVGMLFQFAETDTTLRRVSVFNSATSIDVVELDGSATSFGGTVSAKAGGVFAGVKLVPFGQVDESREPDSSPYDVFAMGSPLQSNPLNGITPFSGEAWSLGWVMTETEEPFWDPTTTDTPSGGTVTDNVENGTDIFAGTIFGTTPPGELFYDVQGDQFTVIQSSQPNTDLQIELAAEANLAARPVTWDSLEPSSLLFQPRRFAVTFYDPATNIEGDPSPELVVRPSGEDLQNYSGAARTKLSALPVDPSGRGFYRRVYASLPGQAELFRVATIEDPTSTSYTLAKSEGEIAAGVVLQRRRARPPRCSVVASTGERLVYASLVGQEDGLIFSQAFSPEQAPITNLVVLDTGDGAAITNAHDLAGRLIVFKGNAVWRMSFASNVARQQLLDAGGSGCVGPQAVAALSGRLYFMGELGPYVLTGASRPQWLGRKVQATMRDEVDPQRLHESSAGVNRSRQQVSWTWRKRGEHETRRRLGMTFDEGVAGSTRERFSQGHTAALYEGPDCVVLGEVQRRPDGQRVPVGVTEDGYVVWLDRGETQLEMRGETTAVWGDPTFSIASVGAGDYVQLSGGAFDTLLDGLAGRELGYKNGDSFAVKVAFYDAVNSRFYFKRRPSTDPAGSGSLAVGRQAHRLLTRIYGFEVPHWEKRLKDVRFITAPDTSGGNVTLRIYTDYAEVAAQTISALGLDQLVDVKHVQSVRARLFQLEIDSEAPKIGKFARFQGLVLTTFDSDKR